MFTFVVPLDCTIGGYSLFRVVVSFSVKFIIFQFLRIYFVRIEFELNFQNSVTISSLFYDQEHPTAQSQI